MAQAILIALIGLLTCLMVFLGLAYKKRLVLSEELSKARRLLQETELARNEAQKELERQMEIVKMLEANVRRRAEDVSSLKAAGEEVRELYAESERERDTLIRKSEEKSQELERRHRLIVDLQDEIENLIRERAELADASYARELALRREYEAKLRQERSRREVLEEKLSALDEIVRLRNRLRRLADELEELARQSRP